jgi:hypothetical protein
MEARSRALLSDGEVADGLYREALERLARTRVGLEVARAHLVYGEWLRGQHRLPEAREQLRAARERFTSPGVEAFAQRAGRELSAMGERVRRRIVERQGAHVSGGADRAPRPRRPVDPEIGARQFISPRTVEYHLHKLFGKLDISSRTQCESALPREPMSELAV